MCLHKVVEWKVCSLWILHSYCLVKNLQISLVGLTRRFFIHTVFIMLRYLFLNFSKNHQGSRTFANKPIGVRVCVVCLFCAFMCDCACGFGQHCKCRRESTQNCHSHKLYWWFTIFVVFSIVFCCLIKNFNSSCWMLGSPCSPLFARVMNINLFAFKKFGSLMKLDFFLANAQRKAESKRTRCFAKKGVFCALGIEEKFYWNHFLWNLLPSDFAFFTIVLCYAFTSQAPFIKNELGYHIWTSQVFNIPVTHKY